MTSGKIKAVHQTGGGTVHYTIKGGEQHSAICEVHAILFYDGPNSDQLYGLQISFTFISLTYGRVYMMLNLDPFTGTGTYTDATPKSMFLTVSLAKYAPGTWVNYQGGSPSVSFTDIFNRLGSASSLHGSLDAKDLTWKGDGDQGTLDFAFNSISINLTDGNALAAFALPPHFEHLQA